MNKINFTNLHELEELAKDKLDSNAFQSGANQEITLRDNVNNYYKILNDLQIHAFTQIRLNPRILRDVSDVNLGCNFLGRSIQMPIGIAPTAMQKLAAIDGELIPASIGYEYQIPFTLSTLSTTRIEDVASANKTGIRIMQLYIQKDRDLTLKLIKKAEANGFMALALTVDAPVLGKRESDERQKFVLPTNMSLRIIQDIADEAGKQLQKVENQNGSGLLKFFADQLDQSLTWKDIEWLKSITNLPIILKGVQSWQDAILARQYGVQGIWVSNHGGRQLDTVRASIDILPEIVEALKDSQIEIYIDGGIRRGSDVFKCLALGAKCVFLGRPILYSAALDQYQGVSKMLNIITDELKQTMRLCGVTQIKQINDTYIIKNTIPQPNL